MDGAPMPKLDDTAAGTGVDRKPAIARLVSGVRDAMPQLSAHARALDAQSAFPAEDLATLRQCGVLLAPLPLRQGGLGLGTEPEGAEGLFTVLRLVGRGSLAVGRIIEGHVN